MSPGRRLRIPRFVYPVLISLFPALILAATALAVRAQIQRRVRALLAEGAIPSPEQLNAAFAAEWLVVAGILATVAVILIVGLVVNRWAMSPYKVIARTVQELADGRYGAQVVLHGDVSTTFGNLAANINLLAATLRRGEEVRRELVSNLAHEIRSPLTNIRGYLEAMRDGVITPDPATVASLHDEVLRLVRLVDALHQLARADGPCLPSLEREPTDLDELAERVIQLSKPTADSRGISIATAFGAQKRAMLVHADSMAQVMGNLLRNAVLYTDEGGVIHVETAANGGVYRFTCRNTGPGIPRAELPLVFNRFYRTARGRQRAGGDGLGLAIVKDLVEAHGGSVGADSRDGWTTIWFEVPV